ncbi:hypothetical protein ACFWHW_26505 [Streptomyces pharetrae]|uniref:hypothetical protein n=1 Tax=Streptomyces pharetrae TaxID=291370 RepID=UPI00365F1B3E
MNSRDSRYFLAEQSGSVAATAVHARVLDSRTGLLLSASAALLGLLAAVGGLAAGTVSWAKRRAAD